MAAKKDLTGAINAGIDRLFSVNDQPQPAVEEQQAQEVQPAAQPHKAGEVSDAQRAADVDEMAAMIAAAEARKTAGHKGYKMQRVNISLTPSEYDYVQIMAGITGKSMTRFIGDLISTEAARNADTYQKAKELIKNAR
jgi:uncharacterized membrane protein YgcG